MKKILLTTILVLILGSLVPFTDYLISFGEKTVHAVETLKETTFDVGDVLNLDETGESQSKYFKDEKNAPIVSFILSIINFALRIIGSIAIVILIIGGFMFMTAQGNQQEIDKAKDVVKYAIIGLLVAFMSYVIVIFVQSLFVTSEAATRQKTSFIPATLHADSINMFDQKQTLK